MLLMKNTALVILLTASAIELCLEILVEALPFCLIFLILRLIGIMEALGKVAILLSAFSITAYDVKDFLQLFKGSQPPTV